MSSLDAVFKSRGPVSLERSFTSSADVEYGSKLHHLSFKLQNGAVIWKMMFVGGYYFGKVSPTIQEPKCQVKMYTLLYLSLSPLSLGQSSLIIYHIENKKHNL